MDARTWELLMAIIGSGVGFSILTWIITKVHKSGTDEANFAAQCEEVKIMKAHQVEQDSAIRKIEKRMEEIDHSIDVRLTGIEIELVHVREMQMSHNADLRATSEDIKALLRVARREA